MHVFKDRNGGEWQIALVVREVRRIKQASDGKFDLLEPQANDLAATLITDTLMFYDLLEIVLAPQVKAKGIDADAFGTLMSNESLVVARKVFFSEWHDFFQTLQRPELALPLQKMTQYCEKALAMAKERVAAVQTSDLDSRVMARMEETANKSYGNWQEQLESILADSPGASSTT